MSVQELGDIDGVQMWWCPDCQASTPALKRNKAPDLKHADGCDKPKAEAAPVVVHALEDLKSPDGASGQ